VQQLPGREDHRYRHTAIDADHAAIPRCRDRVGDVGKGDMPAAGPRGARPGTSEIGSSRPSAPTLARSAR
jgi:hypothetical protein